VRSLSAYLADQRQRNTDDRDLTSRSDRRKERKESEETYAKLARELCECSDKQLKRLDLPDLLRNCVLDARRIESPSAKDRALRLVRRELRNGDADAIIQQVERLKNPKVQATPKLELEWAERIVREGELALNEFIVRFPNAQRQQLTQLLRNVKKANGESQAKAMRLLATRLGEAIRENATQGA